MSYLFKKIQRQMSLLVTASLMTVAFSFAIPGRANTPETANQLTEQQKRELEQMVAESKKQVIEVPALKQHQQFNKPQKKALKQLVEHGQQAITPMLQEEINALLNSKQYQANHAEGMRQAQQSLNLPAAPAEKPDANRVTEGQVVVFISASVPLPTLRNYVKSLVKIKGAMVLRGGIQGLKKICPTLAFSQKVLKIDPHCTHSCSLYNVPVLIDPLLFRQHHITAVPAIAFQPEGIVSGCDANPNAPAGDIIYGDISLTGALEKLHKMAPNTILKTLLTQLEK